MSPHKIRDELEEKYECLRDTVMDLKILLIMAKWGNSPAEALGNLEIRLKEMEEKNTNYRKEMKGIDLLNREFKDSITRHVEDILVDLAVFQAKIKEVK